MSTCKKYHCQRPDPTRNTPRIGERFGGISVLCVLATSLIGRSPELLAALEIPCKVKFLTTLLKWGIGITILSFRPDKLARHLTHIQCTSLGSMLIGDLSNVEIFDFGQQKLPKKAGNDQLSTSIAGEYAYKFPSQCKTLVRSWTPLVLSKQIWGLRWKF